MVDIVNLKPMELLAMRPGSLPSRRTTRPDTGHPAVARRLRRGVVALLLPLAAALAGCAISTPVRLAAPTPADRPDDLLQVSLTHAVVDPARRAPFDRYVGRVVEQLPQQAGLVSYSVRRELLGRQVWTMTAWRSAEDRARFFGSGVHRQAMTEAAPALLKVRTVRLELRRAELPLDWPRALAALGPAPWEGEAPKGQP